MWGFKGHRTTGYVQMNVSLAVLLLIFVNAVLAQNNQSETASADCSIDVLTAPSGNITSPGYPESYANNLDCVWIISRPSDQVIVITFHQILLHETPSCLNDYLEVYNGDEKFTGRRFCGGRLPPNFAASRSNVRVVFHSDDSRSFKGFYLSWTSTARCSTNQYTCWDGECISDGLQCDGIKDCSDGEDEIECVYQASTPGQCGKVSVAPQFTWDPRIVGGNAAVPGSYVWIAMITKNDGTLQCSGTIINHNTILSAAHCFSDPRTAPSILVVYVGRYDINGSQGEQKLEIASVVVHEDYRSPHKGSDIALIFLVRPILFQSTVRPICLPSLGQFELIEGTQCIAVGWGQLEYEGAIPDRLYQVRLPITNQNFCNISYSKEDTPLIDSQLCAGDLTKGAKDSCLGDSGGPLSCLFGDTWYQVGVTSFGIECAIPGFPGVYTKVSSFQQWIQDTVAENKANHIGSVHCVSILCFSLAIFALH